MPTVQHNNVAYDFKSLEIEFVANGTSFGILEGIDEFDYSGTINRVKFYGRSRNPLTRTEGEAEYDASITLDRDWWHFMRAKAQQMGIPLADLEIVIAFTYYAKDQELHTDTITGVQIKEIGNSGKNGPDQQMVKIPLDVMNIYFDGEDVFGNKL
jgi:hypothetical protein